MEKKIWQQKQNVYKNNNIKLDINIQPQKKKQRWNDCVLIVAYAEQIQAIIEKFNYVHIICRDLFDRHSIALDCMYIKICARVTGTL